MLYQLVDGTLVRQFPDYIDVAGSIYTNKLGEEKAAASGEWYELVISDVPEIDNEKQYLAKSFRQEEDAIYLDWVVKDIKKVEDANIFPEEEVE